MSLAKPVPAITLVISFLLLTLVV